MYVRDPLKNLMTYAARETEGKKIGLMAERFGDYEVCFSNRLDDHNPGGFFGRFSANSTQLELPIFEVFLEFWLEFFQDFA